VRNFDRPSAYGYDSGGTLIAGHFREPDTYSTHRPAGMNDWLLAYTLGGEGYFSVPGLQTQTCRAGDVALLGPGTPHRYGTSPGCTWHFVWAHFSAPMIEANLLPGEPLHIRPAGNEYVRRRIGRAFRRLLSDTRERGDYWQELGVTALREILMLLARSERRKLDARVEETLHRLSLHMREPVRIGALARSVGLSPSRLSHLFKENTGQSIVDALNRMRIRQAALLLEHTDRTASEVSYDVGYSNYNHFLAQFRRLHGMSPSEYRKRARSNGS
jgi:AraC family transcriptional regulator of arabinose operon